MLVHPQFDPVALHIGPLAVRWYGLMYLVGFVLFVVLGKIRARQNLLTGWHPRDVDDMLFYGVFGVIIGGRLGIQGECARPPTGPTASVTRSRCSSWKATSACSTSTA